MPLTRDFKETVLVQIEADPEYADALFDEGINCLVDGDTEAGKAIIRDVINGTIGFQRLGEILGKDPKSLMQMFSEDGNPTITNFFSVWHSLVENGDISDRREATG